jgi:hypothetical protein
MLSRCNSNCFSGPLLDPCCTAAALHCKHGAIHIGNWPLAAVQDQDLTIDGCVGRVASTDEAQPTSERRPGGKQPPV